MRIPRTNLFFKIEPEKQHLFNSWLLQEMRRQKESEGWALVKSPYSKLLIGWNSSIFYNIWAHVGSEDRSTEWSTRARPVTRDSSKCGQKEGVRMAVASEASAKGTGWQAPPSIRQDGWCLAWHISHSHIGEGWHNMAPKGFVSFRESLLYTVLRSFVGQLGRKCAKGVKI